MIFKKFIRNFFDPRFSTSEIETSRLKCNLSFSTNDMYFDDRRRGYPTHICGIVKTRRGVIIIASWNQHGECKVKGVRVKSFDLVRPTQSEIDS